MFLQNADFHHALFCVRLSLKTSLSSKSCMLTPRPFLRRFCWVIKEWWTSCPDPVQHSSQHSAETHELQQACSTWLTGEGGSCTGSECQRLDSHDSFITLTAKSPLLHVCAESDAQCPEGGAAERVSAVLTEGNLQRCISTGQWCLMSPPPTLNSYVVYWHKCEWTSLHVLCWDFMAPPQETKRLLLSWRCNNRPIHHGTNTKWVLRWRSPPPQGRQSKVTSWKKSSIKIRWFLKQTSVH